MGKSNLKTFLAGKNPYEHRSWSIYDCSRLKNSNRLSLASEGVSTQDDSFSIDDFSSDLYAIDVLDDGTAINYCSDE